MFNRPLAEVPSPFNEEKIVSFINGAGATGFPMQMNEIEPSPHIICKNNELKMSQKHKS